MGTAVLIDDSALKSVQAKTDESGATSLILTLTDEGQQRWIEATAQNVGRRLATFILGKFVAAPTLREKLRGKTIEISGGFNAEEAALFTRKFQELHPTSP